MRRSFSVVALLLLIQLFGCSHSQLLLYNPGSVVLIRQNETVKITRKQLLSIKWSINGILYTTQATGDGKDQTATVNVVGANERCIRIASAEWNDLENIPQSYRRAKDTDVIPGGKRYKKPSVIIPLRAIEEIRIHSGKLKPSDSFKFGEVPKYIGAGALSGALTAILFTVELDNPRESDIDDRAVLTYAGVGAVAGAVFYPIYKLVKPQHKPTTKVYPINDRGGYKIEIRHQ